MILISWKLERFNPCIVYLYLYKQIIFPYVCLTGYRVSFNDYWYLKKVLEKRFIIFKYLKLANRYRCGRHYV